LHLRELFAADPTRGERMAVQACVGRQIEAPELPIAAWITTDQIGSPLMAALELLHPFGQGNPEPVFGLRGSVISRRPDVFKEQHFRFQLEDARGRRLFGVAWKMAHRLPPVGVPLDFAVEAKWNFFNDRRLLQLQLIDWRFTAE
jgi:single-stranded-DNA-specific exonuclease